jgi:hypothetical protein
MLSPLASTLGSLIGWAVLPELFTKITLSAFASIAGVQVDPRTPQYAVYHKRAFAFVVFAYLVYTIITYIEASPPNFYEILQIPYDADENVLKTAFRAFARRFHPDRVGPQGQARFVEVRDAYESLKHPVKRYAYDRFGPDVLEWTQCTTFRDFVKQGLLSSLGFYIATGGISLLMTITGRGGSGTFWRYTLFIACFVGEVSLILMPSIDGESPFFLHRLLPTGLPFQHVRLLHQLFLTTSAALTRVVPVFFPEVPSDPVTLMQIFGPFIEKLTSLSELADQEVARMITSELRSMHGLSYNSHDRNLQFIDDTVMGYLTQEMENLVIDSQIKVNPKLNSVWTKIAEKPEEPLIRGTSVDTLVDREEHKLAQVIHGNAGPAWLRTPYISPPRSVSPGAHIPPSEITRREAENLEPPFRTLGKIPLPFLPSDPSRPPLVRGRSMSFS